MNIQELREEIKVSEQRMQAVITQEVQRIMSLAEFKKLDLEIEKRFLHTAGKKPAELFVTVQFLAML